MIQRVVGHCFGKHPVYTQSISSQILFFLCGDQELAGNKMSIYQQAARTRREQLPPHPHFYMVVMDYYLSIKTYFETSTNQWHLNLLSL